MHWLRHRDERAHLHDTFASADAFHIHGIWDMHCDAAASYAISSRKPYIISTHGMLQPWALGQKRLKKMIYALLVEKANLRGARCVRALTRTEARDYRDFGVKRPIAIVPNGVDVPAQFSSATFLAEHPELRGRQAYPPLVLGLRQFGHC